MFTGIVEEVGRVAAVEETVTADGVPGARRLTIAAKLAEQPMPLGASLAVDGTCLTVVEQAAGRVAAVAGPETLARTTLGGLAAGSTVNLERPLMLGDRLGGHLVAGHVDGVGRVVARAERGVALDVSVQVPPELLRYVVEKGSIAIDGISLTVNTVDERGLCVSLIPHTRTATTFGEKPVGAAVNLEVDLIGKYVEKLVAPHDAQGASTGGITIEKLRENGFV
jgi:riboflavin synthase